MVILKYNHAHKYAVFAVALCVTSLCQARGVAKVVIDEVGKSLPDRDPAVAVACKKFIPTANQVKRFFSKSYPVEGRMIFHDHYSPCYIKGTVLFDDRSSGEWIIYSGGTASLVWTLGQDKVNLFYGRNKWHDPFACTYGLGDEPEC
jgi:hypothetical protein